MEGKKTFLMYSDVINYIDGLNDHQVAQLYKATLCYANGLPVEIDDPEVKGIWRVIKHNMDQNNAAYKKQCDRNKENVKKRFQKKATEDNDTVRDDTTCNETYDTVRPYTTVNDRNNDNDNDNDNDIKEKVLSNDSTKKKTAKRFIPPTIDEVRAYCSERGNFVDPESFISFYESNGWKVGRNTMVDWKAAVRTWEHRDSRAAPADKYAEIDRQFLERYKDDTE